jgi:hypothetical protein
MYQNPYLCILIFVIDALGRIPTALPIWQRYCNYGTSQTLERHLQIITYLIWSFLYHAKSSKKIMYFVEITAIISRHPHHL